MRDLLSIRFYSTTVRQHTHDFNQLVLPLQGFIEITLDNNPLRIRLGECCVIKKNQLHSFQADEEARFIVADLSTLPDNLLHQNIELFSISAPLKSYLYFLDTQLQNLANKDLEKSCLELFKHLLKEQQLDHQKDKRIENVLHEIHQELNKQWTLSQFADKACLSLSQFKTVFQHNMGMPPMQYLIKVRMEKALALLVHTDTPMAIIAEQVGYKDASTFGKRFTKYFGRPPKSYVKDHK